MGDTEYQFDRAAKQSQPVTGAHVKRMLAVAIAIGAAIAIMYGETWAIERAPISNVACGLAQTADLKRALDGAPVSAWKADAL